MGAITEPWIKTQCTMHLGPEEYEQTQRGLEELVTLRNELVHQFIERFDLFSESGCLAASNHLDHCLDEIDRHRLELLEWIKAAEGLRAEVAAFWQSPAVDELIDHGVLPDGKGFFWPWTPVVRLLRNAEKEVGTDGWTLLDAAIKFIQANHPEETPRKYNCANWKQLLRKSQQFDIRKTSNLESHRGEVWYRGIT